MERLISAGIALFTIALAAGVLYLIWRTQMQTVVTTIKEEAKAEATTDILNGAAQAAAAADEVLASARDPDAIEKELSKGTM